MKKRGGGKFGKNHTTLTEAGALIADIAAKCPQVTKVIHGVISISRGSSGSGRRVKVTEDGHALKLAVTANASHQELYIYAKDKALAQQYIKERSEMIHFVVTI